MDNESPMADVPPARVPAILLEEVGFGWPGAPEFLSVPRLEVRAGERVFVHGPSGSGKSTLLGLMAGIHVPRRGHVRLMGHDLSEMSAGNRDRLRGAELGVVFQQFNLVPYLTVLDNVRLPLVFSKARRRRVHGPEDEGAMDEGARDLLRRLGIDETLEDRRPPALSVGQQQRVAVARALLGRPGLVICDEPTSALDVAARDGFLDVLLKECGDAGAAIVFVSHDPALADHFPRRLDMADFQAVPS
jgi:putative ABC transport system ATP-binding protein